MSAPTLDPDLTRTTDLPAVTVPPATPQAARPGATAASTRGTTSVRTEPSVRKNDVDGPRRLLRWQGGQCHTAVTS